VTAEENEAVVRKLLELVFGGEADAALELISERYVEHSRGIAAGRAGVAEFIRTVAGARDQMRVTIERVIADHQHVVVHLRTEWTHENRETAAIDIFRVADGLVVEHWDVVQPVPAESVNTTPMF
jgi:predicted SnoaL-like aldol condensation-catalyzing enzyme